MLDVVIASHRWTAEECVRKFAATAGAMGEPATLSVGQLKRWRRGDLIALPRPTACRVAEQLFGHRIEDLLAPATAASPVVRLDDGEVTVGPGQQVGLDHPVVTGGAGLAARWRAGGVHHGDDECGRAGKAADRGDAASAAVSIEELEMAAEQSSRFVRRAGTSVSADVVEQLDADVEWLAREYLRRPPYALFRVLAGARTDVFALIDARPHPQYLTALYRIAGRLTALLAHASSDLGHPYAADSHARSAMLCAQYAEDPDLVAYVRWVQSLAAHWRGDYTTAAELAGAGLADASGGHDVLRLTSQQARALAAAGRREDCERSLSQALDARDAVTGEPGPAGVFAFPAGKAAYYASEIRLALDGHDNASRAVAEATEALDLLGSDPETQHCAELHAATRLDLVAAHLALGELDAAADHAQVALALPAESRTVPIMGRVAGARQAFGDARYADTALARDLREQIEVFTAYPAARDLPQLPN